MFQKISRRQKPAVNSQAAAESLESRQLLSATATQSGATVTITGTEGADNITVSNFGSNIRVMAGGQQIGSFRTSTVNTIRANLGGGNDGFTMRTGNNQYANVEIAMGTGNSENLHVETGSVGTLKIDGTATRLADAVVMKASVSTLRVDFGDGADSLQLDRSAIDQVFAEMRGGSDKLSLTGSSRINRGGVNMGGGDDYVYQSRSSKILASLSGGSGHDRFSGFTVDGSGMRMNGFEDVKWQ